MTLFPDEHPIKHDLSLRQKRIQDMIAHYNSIMAKKEGAISIYSHDYAVQKCKDKFYWSVTTIERYITEFSPHK